MPKTEPRPVTSVNGFAVETNAEQDPEHSADVTDGWFEVLGEVLAVRGKNTKYGPTLEVVLETAVVAHVGDLMALIGRYGLRVLFKPAAVQQPLPEPAPVADTEEPQGEPES